MIRGLLHDGLEVKTGIKIGDIDPRKDPKLYQLVSDKALAVGGGVFEAILTQHAFRSKLTG
jgi:xanthine dehydrogenase accessory factor